MIRKRPFTLLELLIALGLVAILLTVLFRFFALSVRMDQKIEQAREILHQQQQAQTRLSSVLTSIAPRSSLEASGGSCFYTRKDVMPGLFVVFDNGIDPNPLFSGPVLGRIYIDGGANLSLAICPLEKTAGELHRKEMLIPHVQAVRFQFLAKKTLQEPDAKSIPVNACLEWRSDWPKNRWDIPSTIRMMIQQDGQEVAFAFSLPLVEPMITYRGQG